MTGLPAPSCHEGDDPKLVQHLRQQFRTHHLEVGPVPKLGELVAPPTVATLNVLEVQVDPQCMDTCNHLQPAKGKRFAEMEGATYRLTKDVTIGPGDEVTSVVVADLPCDGQVEMLPVR